MYSNKEYSLEQFKIDCEKAKERAEGHISALGVFRFEGDEKIPISFHYRYQDAINMATYDCKESEGRFKDYSIEGITWEVEKAIYKFTVAFYEDIQKCYRKNAKASIVMDDNAKEWVEKEKKRVNDRLKDWAAKERWFEEID